jgi:sterol desaturase/sphingolipid hydroxylase (fatty acid hydroxylase superfamily)
MLIQAAIPYQVQQVASRALLNIKVGALYYLIVAAAFSAAWLWWRWRPARRARLQPRPVTGRQIGREILNTVGTLVVFGSVLPVLFALGFGQHTRFYWRIEERGWAYFFLSILLMVIVQDTWFYWTHRLMHHRRLFRWFHLTHHRSTNPNPWTTYSMAPLEALVLSGSTVLTLVLLPATGAAFVIVGWANIIWGVYGHLGYELYPRGLAGHWLGRWMNTSVAHNTHHEKSRYNYGYYFLFWDRLMGTLDPAYTDSYKERVGRLAPAAGAALDEAKKSHASAKC